MIKKFFSVCLQIIQAIGEGFGDENGWEDERRLQCLTIQTMKQKC